MVDDSFGSIVLWSRRYHNVPLPKQEDNKESPSTLLRWMMVYPSWYMDNGTLIMVRGYPRCLNKMKGDINESVPNFPRNSYCI